MTENKQRRHTAQKTAVLNALRDSGSHKSAGEIWQAVSKTNPTLGRATVFRVLANAAEDGDLLKIQLGERAIFDTTTAPHGHIVCSRCGKIADVWLDGPVDAHITDACGYCIETSELTFTGLCPECAAEQKVRNSES